MISNPVTGEAVYRDSGYGLEIPCEHLLEDDTRAVDCKRLKKKENFGELWSP